MSHNRLPGLPPGVKPCDWALRQLRVPAAHEITRGDKNIIVAMIDLGYRHHPDLDGRLWVNPTPVRGDIHGWDFCDDDASLEYSGTETNDYLRGHHVFVAGETTAVAPECPIMLLRVGYANPKSWTPAVRYAVDHGARVLVIPHGYLSGSGVPLFNQGTDFTYPEDSPELREALDYAYDNNCLIFSGTADNRGRRVMHAHAAMESVCAVGSTNRREEPADICGSADYVELGAPAGDRRSDDVRDRVWGCGGDGNYIPFTGGCMAAGFAAGVSALVWSRFPHLSNEEVRQVLRNTARRPKGMEVGPDGRNDQLGYGIPDASRAVSLDESQLCRDVGVVSASVRLRVGTCLELRLRNWGIMDAGKAMVVVYNGDPTRPADPLGTLEKPAKELQTRQIGHSITSVRGLHETSVSVQLSEEPSDIWLEAFCLDRGDAGRVRRDHVSLRRKDRE